MEVFKNPEEAIRFLNDNLEPADPTPNYPNAAEYLGNSGDQEALLPLIRALQQGNGFIRASAASALGHLGREEAIPALQETFLHDSDIYVRSDAVLALGRLKSEESVPFFLQQFPVEDFEVQKRILMAIPKIHTPRAKVALHKIENELQTLPLLPNRKEYLELLLAQGLQTFSNM